MANNERYDIIVRCQPSLASTGFSTMSFLAAKEAILADCLYQKYRKLHDQDVLLEFVDGYKEALPLSRMCCIQNG